MDNPATESASTPLEMDVDGAAALLANIIDPERKEDDPSSKAPPPEPKAETEPEVESEVVETDSEEADADPTVVVKIDGKEIEIKLSELKNGYQRQADYTRKTMEVSEQRKAAEAEIAKTRQEREQYANGLNQTMALLHAQLTEAGNIDWQALLNSDPVEYLKQQHLVQTRQAQLQQAYTEQQKLAAIQSAESEKARAEFLKQQDEALLAKLPEWKDESKAKPEKEAIRNFLLDMGFSKEEVGNVSDHRAVILARKAMLYDQMVAKVQTAGKKVENLPQKVERPGSINVAGIDKRAQAYQRLSKTGKIDDAAALIAQLV